MRSNPTRVQGPRDGDKPPFGVFHFVRGASPAMCALEAVLDNVADSDSPVLIVGESGTGKRTLAFQIHQLSARLGESFREVGCGGLSPEAFQAPLSASNGHGEEDGLLSAGTLFLREIAELTASCQKALLHALGESGNSPKVRARLVASSTRNLEDEIRAGHLREDFCYRISGVCLRLPPLRHRKEDIPVLANFFLETYAELFGRPKPTMSPQALRFFLEYSWPGNVRELENAAKAIVALGDEAAALAALRSSAFEGRRRNGSSEVFSLKQAARAASRQAERELILQVLSRTRWNRKRAAQELQISYKALLYKLKQIGLDDEATSSLPQGESL